MSNKWPVLAERNVSKTHCPQGHEYSEGNVMSYKGWRRCRECHRIATLEYMRARRARERAERERAVTGDGESGVGGRS